MLINLGQILYFCPKSKQVSKIVQLYKKKTHPVECRHPWIFSEAIDLVSEGLEDGDVVTVHDSQSNFLARGHFQNATISVRILTFEDIEIDTAFFRKKIKNAVDVRRSLGLFREDNSIFRLIYGEGDGLPGLIVDYYNKVAVVQCHSIGMYRSVELIADGLKNVLGNDLIAVYSKSSDMLPDRAEDNYLFGEVETPYITVENGVKLNIDWVTGQKTGFFIDQRENRFLFGNYAKGKKVLNTFCYSGGFSLLALKSEAELVHSLDSSKKAIQFTDENIELNGFSNHGSIVADAMKYMKELPAQ